MLSMPDEQQPETPLGDLLPLRVKIVLAKNGIHTVEGVQRAYPHELLKFRGMGMIRLRQIETALFPGKSYYLELGHAPAHHVKGSSLNGPLSPKTVRALARAGITTVEQLRAMKPKDLLKIQGLGVYKLREIERVLFAGEEARAVG